LSGRHPGSDHKIATAKDSAGIFIAAYFQTIPSVFALYDSKIFFPNQKISRTLISKFVANDRCLMARKDSTGSLESMDVWAKFIGGLPGLPSSSPILQPVAVFQLLQHVSLSAGSLVF
jgi:hypothetical protein